MYFCHRTIIQNTIVLNTSLFLRFSLLKTLNNCYFRPRLYKLWSLLSWHLLFRGHQEVNIMLGKFVILSLFIAGAMADCNDCKAAVGAIYQGLQTQEVQDNIVELVANVFGCSEPETRQLDGFDICAVDPADVIGFLEQVEFSQEEAEAVCDHVPGACDRYTGQRNFRSF